VAVLGLLHTLRRLQSHTSVIERNPQNDFATLSTHCARVSPIAASEFQQRQTKLAHTLYNLGAAAYIAEPGPNAQYYANISLSDWRVSERPFLVVITPEGGQASMADKPRVDAKITIITPRFEATRASLLHIPTPDTQPDIIFSEWAEDANPYEMVAEIIKPLHPTGHEPTRVFVDEGARFFVVDGIMTAVSKLGYQVHITPPEVTAIRERKTKGEVDILRCANEVRRDPLSEYQKTSIPRSHPGHVTSPPTCSEQDVHRYA
jgi:Xaa-Pro aminopeptidase